MNKYQASPLSSQIVQEATEWFVEFNEGEVGQTDREAFVDWLKTSPEHIRAYLQVTAHWEEAGALSKSSAPSIEDLAALAREATTANVIPLAASRPDPDARLAATTQRMSEPLTVPHRRSYRHSRHVLAASAAIAMLGAAALFWFEHERGVYTTDIGEQRSIRLGDGSTVDLNAHSKLRVTLREHERDVELIEGQALFRVAKDHTRPFIVHSGDTNVLAVGTQFDINRRRSGTTVTVVEGRVAVFPTTPPINGGPALASQEKESGSTVPTVRSPDKNETTSKSEIFLSAGEQLTISRSAVKLAPNADVTAAIAWTQKQIVFNSTSLSDVVDEFNRYNLQQLVITDPKIADTKISGEFSSINPDSLLKGLDGLNQFSIRETHGRIEISAK